MEFNGKTVSAVFTVDAVDNAVKFTKQYLTKEQQAQARENIGLTAYDDTETVSRQLQATDFIIALNTANEKLEGLTLYGKTTQSGIPTPDIPVSIVSAGSDGDITVSIGTSMTDKNAQKFVISTPNGLHGLPIPSNSNRTDGIYSDEQGQLWVCDEIDFARGVYVQRLTTEVLDGTESGWAYNAETGIARIVPSNMKTSSYKPTLCDKYSHSTTVSGALVEGEYWAKNTQIGSGVSFKHSGFEGVSKWKEYLAANPVKLMYELAEPIETPLSSEVMSAYASLHTYAPDTYITNDSNLFMIAVLLFTVKKDEPVSTCITWEEQNLTEEQKTQARKNIGAVSDEDVSVATAVVASNMKEYVDSVPVVKHTEFCSINLFPGVEYSKALMATDEEGNPTTSSWLALSDFIDVEPNRKIMHTFLDSGVRKSAPLYQVCFYDAYGNHIKEKRIAKNSVQGPIKYIETPANCKKIRIAAQNDTFTKKYHHMLYYGDNVISDVDHYQPHVPLFASSPNYDFRNKNLCVFGDSLAADGSYGTFTWGEIVSKYFGFAKFYNRGIGASRVWNINYANEDYVDAYVKEDGYACFRKRNPSPAPTSGYTAINSAMETGARVDCIPEDTDVLLILAGINDYGDTSDTNTDVEEFKRAYKTMLNKIQERISTAKIIILNCPYYYRNPETNETNAEPANLENHRAIIREIAQEYGLPIIELRKLMGVNAANCRTLIDADGLHYTNTAGRIRMAETVISSLKSLASINQ